MNHEVMSARLASRCWRKIGVLGDRSCPELAQQIHCRNCPVHGMAAEQFFDREPPPGYADEWTAQLAATSAQPIPEERHTAVVFRLGAEWLALPAASVSEICEPRPVRRLAHRTNEVLRGLVAVRGRVQLCVSLRGLLGIAAGAGPGQVRPRFVVAGGAAELWVFDVDEVHGVHAFPAAEVRGLPDTFTEGVARHARGILPYRGHDVGYLSEELLFASLRKAVA